MKVLIAIALVSLVVEEAVIMLGAVSVWQAGWPLGLLFRYASRVCLGAFVIRALLWGSSSDWYSVE